MRASSKRGVTHLDQSQAVTSQCQVIGSNSSTDIANVKNTLSRVRGPGVTVRHKHLAQAEAMKQLSASIYYIVQHHAFAPVETDPESPFLPVD